MLQLQFADAHNHIQDFNVDLDKVIEESKKNGIQHMVCNSTTFDYLPKQMTNCYPFIIPCVGLHPWYIEYDKEVNYHKMEELLQANPALQVGEIGLDFIRAKEKEQQRIQSQIFIAQFQMAIKYNRSISVHCVRASGEMLKIMKKQLKNANYDSSILMHSYNCPKEITIALNKLYPHFYYSFSLPIVNKLESLKNIEKHQLLFETDAPYQYNAKVIQDDKEQTHPRHVRDLIAICSEYLNEPNLQQIVFSNFQRAFKLIQLQK